MKTNRIIEIPIYGVSRENYKKRWDKIRDNYIAYLIKQGEDIESAQEICQYSQYEYRPNWDYNHIIGFIRVNLMRRGLVVSLYLASTKRYRIDGMTRHNLLQQYFHNEDVCYEIKSSDTNEQIIEELRNIINFMISVDVPKRYYIDFTAFDDMINYLDIKRMYENLVFEMEAL